MGGGHRARHQSSAGRAGRDPLRPASRERPRPAAGSYRSGAAARGAVSRCDHRSSLACSTSAATRGTGTFPPHASPPTDETLPRTAARRPPALAARLPTSQAIASSRRERTRRSRCVHAARGVRPSRGADSAPTKSWTPRITGVGRADRLRGGAKQAARALWRHPPHIVCLAALGVKVSATWRSGVSVCATLAGVARCTVA